MVDWDNMVEGTVLCDKDGDNYFEVILVVWDYKDNGSEFVSELLVSHHSGKTLTVRPSMLDGIGIECAA